MKTKQSAGSDLGRLRFALRGLALLPGGELFRHFTAHWSGATDLRRKTTTGFYDLLRLNLARIQALTAANLPQYDTVTVARSTTARLTMQRFEAAKFAVDFEELEGTESTSRLSLILEPNLHPHYVQVGAVDAHFLRPPDDAMLDELEHNPGTSGQTDVRHRRDRHLGSAIPLDD